MRRLLGGVVLGLLTVGAAVADNVRSFPADSKAMTFYGFDGTYMKLSGKDLPAAPGLQIRNQQNLVVLPGSLQGADKLPVRVQFDGSGAVWHVWILTSEEAEAR